MTSKRPPELQLIEDSREAHGLSRLAAAKIARISDTWWRKVELGEQQLTGRRGLRTLAKMANIAQVPPGAMEAAGRPDIESEMARLRLTDAQTLAQAQEEAERMVATMPGLSAAKRSELEERITEAIRDIRGDHGK